MDPLLILDFWAGNPVIDVAFIKSKGVVGLIARLNSMSGGHHLDARFPQNWEIAKQFEVQTVYFVYNPWVSGAENAAWLFAHLPGDFGKRKILIDIEVKYPGYSPVIYAKEVEKFREIVGARYPKAIYTGAWFLPIIADWPEDEEYWWASYPFALEDITGWEQYRAVLNSLDPANFCKYVPGKLGLWQCSGDDTKLEGFGGHAVDGNAFYGTLAECKQWFGIPLDGTEPELPKEEPEPMVDYSKNALGLYTANPAWPNPNYDFVLGYAGKGYDTPNALLKAIETQAAKEEAPFIGHYKFSMAYYTGQQYPMEHDKWPAHHMDYPMQMFERAMLNRNIKAVVIEVTDPNDHTGKPGSPAWVSFASQEFMNRANAWLKTKKPGVPLILGSSNAFIQQYAPGMNGWAHQWPNLICQDAKIDPSTSYPLGTEKPMYLGAADTYWGWKYSDHLVMFNGDAAKLQKYFGIAPLPEPVPATSGVVNLQGLNIRSAANAGDPKNLLGSLKLGAPVEILGRETDAAGNVWLKVQLTGFVAGTWKGKTYVKEI
jgi:GH25 family lysozyme M1 (1,4-beta-N-acetylmuramidase)